MRSITLLFMLISCDSEDVKVSDTPINTDLDEMDSLQKMEIVMTTMPQSIGAVEYAMVWTTTVMARLMKATTTYYLEVTVTDLETTKDDGGLFYT